MPPRSRKAYKNTSIKMCKQIRRISEGRCERCGKIGGKLDGAHIIPVDYEQTAADLDNIVVLCINCHTFGKEAAHNHPHAFTRWLDDYAPGLYERLRERANRIYPKVDWEAKWAFLKAELDKL